MELPCSEDFRFVSTPMMTPPLIPTPQMLPSQVAPRPMTCGPQCPPSCALLVNQIVVKPINDLRWLSSTPGYLPAPPLAPMPAVAPQCGSACPQQCAPQFQPNYCAAAPSPLAPPPIPLPSTAPAPSCPASCPRPCIQDYTEV